MYKRQVNAYLDSKVSQKDNLQGIVYEAMRYSLLAGGKRIRPVLALAAGQVLGEQEACILPFACAIEMIHTYSLIHDDLPAMDDDDYRRGRYSCHKKFGEATAILAGDALLTMAFEIAAEGALALENPKRGLRAIRHIALSAGTEGMIGGQIVDLDAETRDVYKRQEYYLVKDENRAIGTVDKIYPPETRFALAGRTWETVEVNQKAKVIFCLLYTSQSAM